MEDENICLLVDKMCEIENFDREDALKSVNTHVNLDTITSEVEKCKEKIIKKEASRIAKISKKEKEILKGMR